MPEFDPEKFEEKYVHYLTELNRAYRNAFEYMNDRYDSELVHAIDQQVLDESEPFYKGGTEFRIEPPDAPYDRIEGVLVEQDRFDDVLGEYVDRLEDELRAVFDLQSD